MEFHANSTCKKLLPTRGYRTHVLTGVKPV
jgi:hypothetical protein